MRQTLRPVLLAMPLVLAAIGCHGGGTSNRHPAPPPLPTPASAEGLGGAERVLMGQMQQLAVEDAAR